MLGLTRVCAGPVAPSQGLGLPGRGGGAVGRGDERGWQVPPPSEDRAAGRGAQAAPATSRCPWLASRGHGRLPGSRLCELGPGPFSENSSGETRSSSAPLSPSLLGFRQHCQLGFAGLCTLSSKTWVFCGSVLVIIEAPEGDWVYSTRLRAFRAVVGLWGRQEAHPLPAPAGKC